LIQQGFSREHPDVGRRANEARRKIKPICNFTRLSYGAAQHGWLASVSVRVVSGIEINQARFAFRLTDYGTAV
jgi:hypothetical protein